MRRVFSRRTAFDRTPNAWAEAVARVAGPPASGDCRGGACAVDLTVSNPTAAGIPYDEAEILAALASPGALRYEPAPFGLRSARAAVAREIGVDPDRVALTASTSEAYAMLFKLLCDPGDEALVPQPSYPLFEHLATLEGVKLAPYRLAYDGRWHVDLDSVRRAIGPRTRAILAVSPNNPTGSYLKRDELAAIAALGLPIVSDEVFASYPLRDDPSRAETALEAKDALVFALGGLSKLAALPQMKLGWIAMGGPRAALDEARARLEIVCDAFLSVGAPVQHALPRLLASRARAHAAIAARTRANLTSLQGLLAESAATLLDVEGGWYAVVRLPATRSEEAWVDALLASGVVVHPGHFFDFSSEPYVVASLLAPEPSFAEGAARLAACVEAAVADPTGVAR
jgi:hypothetical protein